MEHISEPDTDMARIRKGKVSSMQQMSDVRRQRDTLRRYHKETGEIKYTVTKMSAAFGRLKNQLDMASERIGDLENMSLENSQTEKEKKNKQNKTLEDNTQELRKNQKDGAYVE